MNRREMLQGSLGLPFVKSVKRMRLDKGDIVILTAPDILSNAEIDMICRHLREAFPDNKCLVMDGGKDIKVIRGKDIEVIRGD